MIEWVGTIGVVGKHVVASIHKDKKGWHAAHLTWVSKYLKPPKSPCKTEAGIRRRVAKYVGIWEVAGKPMEEHK